MDRSCTALRTWISILPVAVLAVAPAGATAGDDKQPTIAVCDKKIGTLSVVDPEQKWWAQFNLESPEALIKVLVAESKCFSLLDRGKGLAAAQKERELASGGEMRVGSNVGQGQMKAVD